MIVRSTPSTYRILLAFRIRLATVATTMCLLAVTSLAGCRQDRAEETLLFERAEESFSRGDYDGATVLYKRFLTEHPMSPLSDTARRRLLVVERELDAVMGRRGAPAPVHVPPVVRSVPRSWEAQPLPSVHAPALPALREQTN